MIPRRGSPPPESGIVGQCRHRPHDAKAGMRRHLRSRRLAAACHWREVTGTRRPRSPLPAAPAALARIIGCQSRGGWSAGEPSPCPNWADGNRIGLVAPSRRRQAPAALSATAPNPGTAGYSSGEMPRHRRLRRESCRWRWDGFDRDGVAGRLQAVRRRNPGGADVHKMAQRGPLAMTHSMTRCGADVAAKSSTMGGSNAAAHRARPRTAASTAITRA